LADYCFSIDWAQGGPIIEREGIGVYRECVYECHGSKWATHEGTVWEAIIGVYQVGEHECAEQGLRITGPTALVAAMRCYVASKLGDEVEVPDELRGESNGTETK
jgi:hypothetical protein